MFDIHRGDGMIEQYPIVKFRDIDELVAEAQEEQTSTEEVE